MAVVRSLLALERRREAEMLMMRQDSLLRPFAWLGAGTWSSFGLD